VSDTRGIWLKYKDPLGGPVPPSEYPASVKSLSPELVWATRDGINIVTYSAFVERAGIFIRHNPSFIPPETGDPGYSEIVPNVYWYYAPG